MKIRKGTYDNGERVHWIETRPRRDYTLSSLADGLCSHYIRNRVEDGTEEPLPTSLTAAKIVEIAHQEYDAYGTNAVWTWSDGNHTDIDDEQARDWAERLILAALPGLSVPTESE